MGIIDNKEIKETASRKTFWLYEEVSIPADSSSKSLFVGFKACITCKKPSKNKFELSEPKWNIKSTNIIFYSMLS